MWYAWYFFHFSILYVKIILKDCESQGKFQLLREPFIKVNGAKPPAVRETYTDDRCLFYALVMINNCLKETNEEIQKQKSDTQKLLCLCLYCVCNLYDQKQKCWWTRLMPHTNISRYQCNAQEILMMCLISIPHSHYMYAFVRCFYQSSLVCNAWLNIFSV